MSLAASVRANLESIDAETDALVAGLVAIASIPAPTGQEAERAVKILELWRTHGMPDAHVDDTGNVVGRHTGARTGPTLLVVANMDHAYPAGTDCTPVLDGTILRGPGVYDNAAGLAVMLGASAFVARLGQQLLPGDLIFAATVGEESGGNLRGMRALMDQYGDETSAVLNVGHELENLHHAALGATTLSLRAAGPGGHSYGNLGSPSAVHGLVGALSAILDIDLPSDPKTSLNIGLLRGGLAPNSIAEHAEAVVELRSTSTEVLRRVEREMRDTTTTIAQELAIELTWTDFDRRPSGAIPSDHPVVTLIAGARHELAIGVESHIAAADFSEPLARGIPAVVVGAGRGGGVKSANEYLDTSSLAWGVKSLAVSIADLMEQLPRETWRRDE